MSVALVIGASRLVLDVHTGVEVMTGGAVGVCGAMSRSLEQSVSVRLRRCPSPHVIRIR